jgi:hypothetical protein
MDIAQLAARAKTARTRKITCGPRVWTILLPTWSQIEQAAISADASDEKLQNLQILNALVEKSVAGWEGVIARDICDDVPDEPLEFSAAAVRLVLECLPEDVRAIRGAITEGIAAQKEERKN